MTYEEYLDNRCKKHHQGKRRSWFLHEFDNSGADYGLIIEVRDGVWIILSYSDSGYSPEKILGTDVGDNLLTWIESFKPTNPNYDPSKNNR